MKKLIKKYWWLICLLISIPLILSVCCYFSLPFFNEAGSAAWLGFWGGYLGSTIMAGVTLYVLDRQLKQNQNENSQNRANNDIQNESNRNLSEKLRLQEIEIKWFEDLKQASSLLYSAFNSNDVVIVSDMAPLSDEFHGEISRLLTRMNQAFFNFHLVVSYHNGITNLHELNIIQRYVNEYLSLLSDMDSLHIYGKVLQKGLEDIDLTKEEFDLRYKEFILNHKKNMEIPEISENRVWDLLINNRFDRIEYINEVLNILRKRIDNFPMINVGDAISKLIKSEYKKIKEYNGAEQDK